MAHFSRKCYSTVKQQLQTEAGYTSSILSLMDTTFMGTYAVGNIVSGKLGDTFSPTTVLAIGLFGSGACLFLINVSLWFDFVGFSMALGNFFILAVYFVFGFFQSTGGPVSSVDREREVCFSIPFFRILAHTIFSIILHRSALPSWAIGLSILLPSRIVVSFLVAGRVTSIVVTLPLPFVPLGSLALVCPIGGPCSFPP